MKVVNFNDACYKPDPDAIDLCEKLLEKAKSGGDSKSFSYVRKQETFVDRCSVI